MVLPAPTVADPLSSLPFTVPTQYRADIYGAATQYGIRPELLAAQIEAESGFQNLGPNSAGAVGIAQFMPATALGIGVNPRDTHQSIYGAARLDSAYIKQFGSEALALAAYNAGPGAVERAGNAVPDFSETKAYVARILGWAGGGGTTPTPSPSPTAGATDKNASLGNALGKVSSGSAWQRFGKGALGILLAMVGFWFAFGSSGTVRTIKGQAKDAVKVAKAAGEAAAA